MSYGTRLTVDDKMRSLFQMDPVLPAQYQNTFQRRFPLLPEKTLMLAVLEDAVTCYQTYALARSGKAKDLFDEAERWIFQTDNGWLFSFEQICSALGWDAAYVRRGLAESRKALLARPRKAGAPEDEPKKKYKRRLAA